MCPNLQGEAGTIKRGKQHHFMRWKVQEAWRNGYVHVSVFSLAHVGRSLFLSGPAKLELGLVTKDEETYYETVVSRTSKQAFRPSKQAFRLTTPTNIHGVQEFEIGTTQYSPTDKRKKYLLSK